MKKAKNLTSDEMAEIQSIINPVLGARAWGVALGIGSFVTINFGARLETDARSQFSQGEWHLWIQHCVWRVEKDNSVVIGSEDPRSSLKETIKIIEGLALQSVSINVHSFETTFSFDKDTNLTAFPVSYWGEDEYWWLFTPKSKVLVAGPGMNWSYENADRNS